MVRLRLIRAGFFVFAAASFAQTAPDDPGIAVDPGASLRHRAPVRYPKDTLIAGTVEIEASLSAKGEVNDARVVSGPEELRKEALWSVLQWHYSPGTATPVHVSIRFEPAAQAPLPTAPRATGSGDDFVSGIFKTIEFVGIAPGVESQLRARLPFREGDPLLHSDFEKITSIVQELDEHLTSDVTGRIAAPDAHRDLTIHIHAATPASAVLRE
jgi:Gram-negative bacterial TonB protein C-terminal